MATSWPTDIRPSTMSMVLRSNTRMFRSKLSGATQTARTPGTRWVISMTFSNLSDDEARKLEALRTELDGSAGRVICWDFGRLPYVVGGTPYVSAANQMGTQLVTAGWPAGILVLRQGDYFMTNGELKQLTQDAVSTSSGAATLVFGPALRRPPPVNSLINVNSPYSVFMLTDSDVGIERHPAFSNNMTINLEEDVL